MNEIDELLTIQECAELLRVSDESIRRLAHKGDLPGLLPRIGKLLRVNRRIFLEHYGLESPN